MKKGHFLNAVLLGGMLAFSMAASAQTEGATKQSVWMFDRLENIGGFKTEVEGHPKVIDTVGGGKAVEFNGVDDAIWIENHPLAGWKTFTFEAIFRPDGGDVAQRWFHLASIDPKTGLAALPSGTDDPNPRFTFELRVSNHDHWYLDAFTHGCGKVPDVCTAKQGYNQGLMVADKTYPIGHWYAVAQTYDGKMFRSYVNGVLQGEVAMDYKPQGPGRASIGTRMNRVNYFRGAVMEARFTPTALPPDQLLKVPPAMDAPDPPRRAP